MGFLKAFDRSPEAVAAGIETARQDFGQQIGQPIELFLAGLTPPGALSASLAGWGLSRKEHRATGGATDRKHQALLVVTGDGALRLFRSQARQGRIRVGEEVRVWPAGTVRVSILVMTWRVGLVVDDGTGDPLAFEMVSDQAVLTHVVRPFAARLGAVVQEG